jgi:hypothetical protein
MVSWLTPGDLQFARAAALAVVAAPAADVAVPAPAAVVAAAPAVVAALAAVVAALAAVVAAPPLLLLLLSLPHAAPTNAVTIASAATTLELLMITRPPPLDND